MFVVSRDLDKVGIWTGRAEGCNATVGGAVD
jgi:hypothetical protein